MQRLKTIAVALIVMGAAIGAAYLLFGRRDAPTPPTGQSDVTDSSLSAADSRRLANVPLQVPPESGTSPAVGLYDPAGDRSPSAASAGAVMPARVDRLESPPELAARYSSLLDSPTSPTSDRSSTLSEKTWPATHDPRPRSPATERRHVIVDGDTLADLAKRYLGSADRWNDIYQANRAALSDPELLPIGLEIAIPGDPGTTGDPTSPLDHATERTDGAAADNLVPVP